MSSIDRASSDFIPQDCKLRPYGNKIIVKPLEFEPSKIINCIREGRPVRGEVLAVGKGAYRKRYNKDRSKVFETNDYIPMSVKVGDVVEWGGLNIFDGAGYSFDSFVWGTDEVLIITEQDVCGIVEA